MKPAFPDRACFPEKAVHAARVPAGQSLHQAADVLRVGTWIDDEMNVIGHQAVPVHLQGIHLTTFLQGAEIVHAIEIAEEHRTAIVAALNKVVRIPRKGDSHSSGHCLPPSVETDSLENRVRAMRRLSRACGQ
jgi:hypothetical protein